MLKAVTLGAVTHTHTHTQIILEKIKAMLKTRVIWVDFYVYKYNMGFFGV